MAYRFDVESWLSLMTKIVEKYIAHVSKYFLIYLTLCYLIPYFRHYLAYLNGDIADWQWKSTQYIVNYFDFGFTKRALLGSLIHLFEVNRIEVLMISFTTIFFFLWVYAILNLSRPIDCCSQNILKTLLALSPFTAFQSSLDVGRFDIINMLIFVNIIFLLFSNKVLTATVLSCCAILIHEAFVIYALPIIFSLQLSNTSNYSKSKYMTLSNLMFYIMPICLAVSLALFGNNDQVSNLNISSGANVWSRSLFEPKFGQDIFDMTILFVIVCILYLWLFVFYKCNSGKLDLLFFSSFCSATLFLFGVDYARWCSIIFMVIISVVTIKIRMNKWALNVTNFRLGMGVFLLPLGPIGITNFFPFLRGALKFLFN